MVDYMGGNCLTAYDFTGDLSDCGAFHLIDKGSIRLEMRFAAPLDSSINVLVFGEWDLCHIIGVMNSRQLYSLAKSDQTLREYGFFGVFSPDPIPIKALTVSQYTLISNTQDSNKDDEHWVALHIDNNCRGWYFVSFGAAPNVEEFLRY